MPILSRKDTLRLRLDTIPLNDLKALAENLGMAPKGNKAELILKMMDSEDANLEKQADDFIKSKYRQQIEDREKIIRQADLQSELNRVEHFDWGVVQGGLDQKIQREFVRKFYRYGDLLEALKKGLYQDVTNYAVCSWFNHWTTVLIEEHIALHPKVLPALSKVKGVDIFFNNQPFDLKTTYLPRDYNPEEAVANPRGLAKWLYEHQGAERFGDDNRFFVVVFDQKHPDQSWKLKREFQIIFPAIDKFLDQETITEKDEIVFTFKRNTYSAIAKTLIIYR